jgi:DNA (cytosine-5)-methyltransferase 1
MGYAYNHGQNASEICSSSTQRSDTSSTWQEQTRQLERSSEQYAELANTDSNRLHGGKTEWDRESEWSICKNQPDNRSEIWSEIDRCSEFGSKEKISDTQVIGLQGSGQHEQSLHSKTSRQGKADGLIYGRSPEFWAIEPNVGRVAHGVASRVDRIKAIGNGQVPLCAATAWRILK